MAVRGDVKREVRASFYFSRYDLVTALRAAAFETDRSQSDIVEEALLAVLPRLSPLAKGILSGKKTANSTQVAKNTKGKIRKKERVLEPVG